jgi:hypothetical protein
LSSLQLSLTPIVAIIFYASILTCKMV